MKTDDEGTQRLQAARKRKDSPEDEDSTYPARKAAHPREVDQGMDASDTTPDPDAATVSWEEAGSTGKSVQTVRVQKRGAETKVEDLRAETEDENTIGYLKLTA